LRAIQILAYGRGEKNSGLCGQRKTSDVGVWVGMRVARTGTALVTDEVPVSRSECEETKKPPWENAAQKDWDGATLRAEGSTSWL